MQVHGAKLRGNACIEEIDYRAARGLDKSVIRALTQESLLAMPGFILWLPGAQGLGQVVPEFEKPVIQHRQPAADITRAAAVQIESARRSIEVLRRRPIAFTVEEPHGYQSVEEIRNASMVHSKLQAQFCPCDASIAEFGEHAEADGSEEHFGGPEGKGCLKNGAWIELRACFLHGLEYPPWM